MLEFITQGPTEFCGWLASNGLPCSTEIFVLNVWNLISGFLLFILAWAVIAFIMQYRSLDRYHITHNVMLPYRSLDDTNIIKMHPLRMRKMLGEKRLKGLGTKALTDKLNEEYQDVYFLVIFKEAGRTVLKRELRIAPLWVKTGEDELRADPETMRLLKKGSISPLDDDTDNTTGVDGVFDVFVRPIRWWDIRHWIFHPNREVKIGVRVAIFITALEYSSDIWRFIKVILRAPF